MPKVRMERLPCEVSFHVPSIKVSFHVSSIAVSFHASSVGVSFHVSSCACLRPGCGATRSGRVNVSGGWILGTSVASRGCWSCSQQNHQVMPLGPFGGHQQWTPRGISAATYSAIDSA
uniref:Uncharacterized protein n=1 Tax=Chlamydomonas euryale TaxID=1486919 RepID=A0A7R9VRC9_9CHLO